MIKSQAFDSSFFRDKNHFEENGTQNYLVYQPMYQYFLKIGNTDYMSEWKPKGLSDEVIKPPTTFDNSVTPRWSYIGNKTRVNLLEIV